MDQKAWKEKVDLYYDGHKLFKIAKKRIGEKRDVAGFGYLEDESGVMKESMDDQKKIWNEHIKMLKNAENEWSDSIDANKVEGAVRIEVEEVWGAINQIKIGKASGLSGVALKMFKAGWRC